VNSKVKELLANLRYQKNPSETVIDGFKKAYPNIPLDYLETMRIFNGGEGWINASYIRFYPLEDLSHVNHIYHVQEFLPKMLIFASTGGGEAYAFNFDKPQLMITKIPFIPLDIQYGETISTDFESFILQLASEETENKVIYEINEESFQKEVHEKHPVVFGGDPVDPNNKILVPTDAHAEISYFWNGVFQRTKKEKNGG
jgi:hypothetical protein